MSQLYIYNGISRQGHFDALQRSISISQKEPCYIGFIESIREIHPGMGLRKMYEQFKPEDIGRDAFVSLGLREGYRLKTIEKPHRTTYSVKSNRYVNLLLHKEFTGVNQIWVSDLFYYRLGERHYYVVLITDVYSRRIVGYSLADNMRAENNVKALYMALNIRGIKNYNNNLIHHSDRGSQYVSDDYTNILSDHGVQISMCNYVLENAHCERVNGTIKNQYLNHWSINNYKQLLQKTVLAIDSYNNRLHESIKMTPLQYESFLETIPTEKRNKMTIFTLDYKKENPAQIEIEF